MGSVKLTRSNSPLCLWFGTGFEKMERGSLGAKYQDRTNPVDKHVEVMLELREVTMAPFTPQMFGNAGREHMEKYGVLKTLGLWRQTTAPHLTHAHTHTHQAPLPSRLPRLPTRTTSTL